MKVLELFSGTGSVGKVCIKKGWDVVSVDIDGRADITIDILKWDYKKDYKEGDFNIIWASPECSTFSQLRRTWIGRKLKVFGDNVVTSEMLDNDMIENGLPLLRKTEEIIEYFKPKYFFIENPRSSKMKDYIIDKPYYDVDYCSYSDWGYKKPTRIWTNKKGFNAKKCDKKNCRNIINGKHAVAIGVKYHKDTNNTDSRYRIPSKLINELVEGCEK